MDEASEAVHGETFEDYQRIRRLVEATNKEKPTRADVFALRAELEANPKLWRFAGNTARLASESIINRAGTTAFLKESVARGMEVMRGDLGYKDAPPLERLLIEQVVLCWVRLHLTEIEHSQYTSGKHTLTAGIYWEKRLTAAQRRYTRAVETLAKVRALTAATRLMESRTAAAMKHVNNVRTLKALTA